MCSYCDALEEGRWFFLEKLASSSSSSSFLQENGGYYHNIHYVLCVLRQKEGGRRRRSRTMDECQCVWLMTEVWVEKSSEPTETFKGVKQLVETQNQGQKLPADILIFTHCSALKTSKQIRFKDLRNLSSLQSHSWVIQIVHKAGDVLRVSAGS